MKCEIGEVEVAYILCCFLSSNGAFQLKVKLKHYPPHETGGLQKCGHKLRQNNHHTRL